MPTAVYDITMQEANRLYESLHRLRGGELRQQTCFADFDAHSSQETSFFVGCVHVYRLTAHPMDRAEVLQQRGMTSNYLGKIRPAILKWFSDAEMLLFAPKIIFAAGGKPSTWFPPGGLVETANAMRVWIFANNKKSGNAIKIIHTISSQQKC